LRLFRRRPRRACHSRSRSEGEPRTHTFARLLTPLSCRLAIISSLEQLALSVLSQVVDNVAPPASRPVDTSQAPARPPWKQVRVVLAKRGGSKTCVERDLPRSRLY
jgi:hypothetical protein